MKPIAAYSLGTTIAAIATAAGEGGVAIVRISGKSAFKIVSNIFSKPLEECKSHTAHFGWIVNDQGQNVDQALVLIMRGPNSYTGEDTIEIQCHGGSLITRRVLDVVLKAGALPASAGEFTFRAFINGKLDLAQAEAVQELIMAKNEHAVDAANTQLQGSLSVKVKSFQKKITHIAAMVEAWVDFPEEDLEFASSESVRLQLNEITEQLNSLISTFHNGKIIHEGLSLCLVGAPNVGKSSLMNVLLDQEKAIVSPIAGTTRDLVEGSMRLNGLNLRLVDTAGIRSSSDPIEQEGIKRSFQAIEKADLVLFVADASQKLSCEELQIISSLPSRKTIVIWNKSDLLPSLDHFSLAAHPFTNQIAVSAYKNEGIAELHQLIDSVIWEKGPPSLEEVVITNVRHKISLEQASHACQRAVNGFLTQQSPEFLSADIRHALYHLSAIIGTDVEDDILTEIFSTFCIGK